MKPSNTSKQSSRETYKNGPANRRVRVGERLETQLVSKVKPNKEGKGVVPLTEQDVKRIQKELTTIKSK